MCGGAEWGIWDLSVSSVWYSSDLDMEKNLVGTVRKRYLCLLLFLRRSPTFSVAPKSSAILPFGG